MTSLMDKIRATLGRHAPQPRETSESYGAPRAEDAAPPLPGGPTLGSALGGYAEGMPGGDAAGPEPDNRT
jgi:hypothetical protein